MTMMTPEKLRALADVLVAPIGRVTTQSLKIDLRAAASAWEADRLAGHEWAAEGKVNRARIEALEREMEDAITAIVASRNVLLDVTNDMPFKGRWFKRVARACGPLTDFLSRRTEAALAKEKKP